MHISAGPDLPAPANTQTIARKQRDSMKNPASPKPSSALVVDNDTVSVKLISSILSEKGYAITCAYSGLEALRILAETTFELVFLDLIMPRIGGDRICRYITESQRHAHTRVCIVSGAALEGRQKIAELKPFACIAKAPYDIMRKNILGALKELNNTPHDNMLLFTDGVHPRSVVEELLFSQRHFESILSSMTEAVFELDTNGIITYVNESARRLLGRQEWELIGHDFCQEFSNDSAAEISSALNHILHTVHTRSVGLNLLRQDRELFLSLRNVLRDEELLGATVVINDVTEKKQLDQERCLRDRLTGVIEMAGAAAHELNQPLTVISGHAQLLLRHCAGNEALERHARLIYDQVARLGRLTRQFSGIATYKTKDYCDDVRIIDIERATEAGTK